MAVIALDLRVRTRAFMNGASITTWVNRLALPCLVAVGAALRLFDGGRLSLRLDEGQSLHFALLSLKPYDATYQHTPSLFQAAAADVHPPGYLLLLHEWIARFGTDTVVLRIPSELAAIATIPLLYLLARRLYSHHIGLLASTLGAASPFWIWHAQEARMYSFLVLFATAATLGLVYAIEDRRIWGWVLFTLATGFGIYFHYFAFAVLAAHLVYVGIRASRLGLSVLKPAALVLAFLSVAYLPWIWMLVHFYRGAGDPNLAPPDAYAPLLLLSDFLLGHLTGDGCLAVACVPGPGCRKFWCSSELAGPLAMDHPSRADNRCFRVVPDLEADSLGPLSHRRDARSLHSSGGRGGENPSRADPSGRHRLDSNPDVARAGR